MSKPLLSIAMIVKNEIRCIERCMKALKPLREAIPCQLVVADTGSTDGTREVVQRYADIFFDFVWINDFSAARNAVLDRCTGAWAFVLDADEYMDSNVAPLVDFLTGPDADDFAWGFVDGLNYDNVEMKGTPADSLALRLARMDQHPRYVGAVHESFEKVSPNQVIVLLDVKFHHDGYVKDAEHPERYNAKMQRNLDLLEEELAENPLDLRRLLQCVESSGSFPVRKLDYIRRAMDVLAQKDGTRECETYGPIICRYALAFAGKRDLPELEKWKLWAMERYGDSMFLRLDGNFALVKYYLGKKDYQKIPELVQKFLAAWEDFWARRFDVMILTGSTVQCTGRKFEVYIRAAGCQALSCLGRSDEAAKLLAKEPDWDGLMGPELRNLLIGAAWVAENEIAQSFVAQGAAKVKAMAGPESAGMWNTFLAAAEDAFQTREDEDAPRHPWRLYSKTEGGLGQAAQLMDAEAKQAPVLLEQIENWDDVPISAAVRVVELDVSLPTAFFAQRREQLLETAARLCKVIAPDLLLSWAERWDFTQSMTRFQFFFDLLAAMMCKEKIWKEQADWQLDLIGQFLSVAKDYLFSYYNQELLADQSEWSALPGLHCGALHLLQGQEALSRGDQEGYIHSLRLALWAAPNMKEAVAFLMEYPPLTPNGAELTALARQVRDILEKYDPDDLSVAELKRSEVYQKVAPLLQMQEEMKSGGTWDV